MTKKKIDLSLITKVIVLVFSAITILSFFLPSFGAKDAEETGKYSHCQVCFLSEESAKEKASDLRIDASAELVKGNTEEAKKLNEKATNYSIIAGIKDSDFEGRTPAIVGAWFHFAAAVASAIAFALTLFTLFAKKPSKFAKFGSIAAFACMIAALICGLSFLGTETTLSTIGDSLAFRFGGVILGLISAIIAAVVNLIPCAKKKKSK